MDNPRYLHTAHKSPGGPNGETPEPTDYPRHLHGRPQRLPSGDWDYPTLSVDSAEAEEAAMTEVDPKNKNVPRWKRLKSEWAKVAVLIALCVLGFLTPVSAQTILNSTTLSAAQAGPGLNGATPPNTLTLTTIANIAVGDIIWAGSESQRVQGPLPTTGTTLRVLRGQDGTTPLPHASGDYVQTGSPDRFYNIDPPTSWTACTRSSFLYMPWINVTGKRTWVCQPGGTWTVTTWMPTVTGGSYQNSRWIAPWEPSRLFAALGW